MKQETYGVATVELNAPVRPGAVTVRHCPSHTSGLPDVVTPDGKTEFFTWESARCEEFTAERFFKPLDMTATSDGDQADIVRARASMYTTVERSRERMGMLRRKDGRSSRPFAASPPSGTSIRATSSPARD